MVRERLGGMVGLDVAVFARGGFVLCCACLSQQDADSRGGVCQNGQGLVG